MLLQFDEKFIKNTTQACAVSTVKGMVQSDIISVKCFIELESDVRRSIG